MNFEGKTVVVTGGASGIGAALAARFSDAGARVCVLDISSEPGVAGCQIRCDVSDEQAVIDAIADVDRRFDGIDVYVSNAGVLSDQPDAAASASNADWARCWSVNVMAHVYAARVVLPRMARRGSGRFVIVASAAGLLNQIGDAAYSATKHAAVSFAESLAITHGDAGVGVSLVCPQYVATPLIGLSGAEANLRDSLMTADEVAAVVLEAVDAGKFLVLPHPEVARFARNRAADHDAWIEGMKRLRQRAIDACGDSRPERFYLLV